jgi:hypothetical protein
MRGILIVVLLALLIIGFVYISKNQTEKTSVEQMVAQTENVKPHLIDQTMNNILVAINSFYENRNEYPEQLDLLAPFFIRTDSELIDPWGEKLYLQEDQDMNLHLCSAGPDRIINTSDDIKRRIQ